MDTKNNSDTDNNVLTKFQPMPKRFMVWDDEATDWICVPGTERDVWDLLDLIVHRPGLMKHKFHMQIVQSTNLFDKDGKEIFEGSIIMYEANGEQSIGFIEMYRYLGQWIIVNSSNNFDVNAVGEKISDLGRVCCKGVELIGHTRSDPELLEEENV